MPAQLNVLSPFAEKQGTESTDVATFDKCGSVFLWAFHHSRTFTLLAARLKEWNIENCQVLFGKDKCSQELT